MKLISLRPKSAIYKEFEDLKIEYENELEKLKTKVSDFDTTILMHQNQKLREENKQLKEKIKIYEKCIINTNIFERNEKTHEMDNTIYTNNFENQDVRYTE